VSRATTLPLYACPLYGDHTQKYVRRASDLRVLDHSPQGAGYSPGHDRDRGGELADVFAGGPEETFFRTLEEPALAWRDLDELAGPRAG
jgi:hypothetical protein